MNLEQIGQFFIELVLIVLLIRLSLLFFKQGSSSDQRHKLFYASASMLYSAVFGLDLLLINYNFDNPSLISHIKDWINIAAVVLTLSALGLMIRESKPKIAQAPVVLAFIPFLILAVYPFVADTFVLKRFLFILLEGGGILIAFLMYTNHFAKQSDYKNVLLYLLLIAVVVGMNLFLNQLVTLTMILAVVSVYGIHRTYKSKDLQF